MRMKLFNCILIPGFLMLTGCATIDGPTDPSDPFESYNRGMYQFNDKLDQYVLKPVAKGYASVTPAPVRKSVGNFFSNLDGVPVIFNDLLQLKIGQFASDSSRLVINSTVGIYGLIDWASDIGLKKHNEDFGQTLGYWGMPSGPYLVLPVVGPSTLRDTAGLAVDLTTVDPVFNEVHKGVPFPGRDTSVSYPLAAIKVVDNRARLLKADKILSQAALDRYIYIREAYLQKRKALVHDGNPPEDGSGLGEDGVAMESKTPDVIEDNGKR